MDFETAKKRVMEKYHNAISSDLVDKQTISINKVINNLDNYYTTSSCYGRVIVISKSGTRSKYSTTFHYKLHDPGKIRQIDLFNINFEGQLWFLLEAPNFHIICKSIDDANKLHKSALEAKLGLSKIQSLSPSIVVEVLGTARMQLPLGRDGKLLLSEDYIEFLLDETAYLLSQDQDRLEIWNVLLKNNYR